MTKNALDMYTLYWGDKEPIFNTPTNTTTNLDSDNYYWMPMEHQNNIFIRRPRKVYHRHISGITDEGSSGHEGYEVGEITLSGPMFNMDMLYQMCRDADNSGAATPFTHEFSTAVNDRQHDTTFPIIARQRKSGTDILLLFTGCVIKQWSISWNEREQLILTVTIELGREWTATALKTAAVETWPTKPAFPFGPSEFTYTFKKATVPYTGRLSRFLLEWNDRARLDVYDVQAVDYSYGHRSISIDFDWVADSASADWTDSQDKTNFDLHNRDIDITLSFIRTAANDEVLIELHKLCWIIAATSDFTHNDFYEKRHYKMGMDSNEVGYLTSIVVHDANDATRFT